MKITKWTILFLAIAIIASGCMSVKLNFLSDKTDPLQEFRLSGADEGNKILLLNIDGIISNTSGFNLFGESPSMVEEIASQLEKASYDPAIKALILKIDSPGGATTASDIIYHEINSFKKKRGVKVFAMMMDVAASGGYMVALPSDKIFAQPTTVTGSIGVVFMRPKFDGLMNKIGIDMNVSKSGENKDMGSPFRPDSEQEKLLFDEMVKELNKHFYDLVLKHRKIKGENLEKVRSARVFLPEEAKNLGLIDEISYPTETIAICKKEAGLPENAKLIVYRRKSYPNDNLYNRSSVQVRSPIGMLNIAPLSALSDLKPGFYYLWTAFSGF